MEQILWLPETFEDPVTEAGTPLFLGRAINPDGNFDVFLSNKEWAHRTFKIIGPDKNSQHVKMDLFGQARIRALPPGTHIIKE